MTAPTPSRQAERLERQKQVAAERAVEFVESGMVVGLGAGSTAAFALRRIAELLRQGELHAVAGIPCSNEVGDAARRLGIPLTTLQDCAAIDLTIDGADEVDPELNLIKGGGAARSKPHHHARLDELYGALRRLLLLGFQALGPSGRYRGGHRILLQALPGQEPGWAIASTATVIARIKASSWPGAISTP